MKCYYHPTEEAVSTCAKCGVGLCRNCESNALLRDANGTGRALCPRCGLNAAQSAVDYESDWLKKRLIKLIICGGLTLFGIISYLTSDALISMFLPFFIAGIIGNIGLKKQPQSIKSQVYDAYTDAKYPISSMIGSIIGYTLFAPILFVMLVIGYLKTKKQYEEDLVILDQAKAKMGV